LFFIFQVFMRESVDMASGKEYMTYIMEQLSDIEDISCRPMMGEYILYYRGKVFGAVWTRIMDDYGHVDDDTPSFAISLYKENRGQGIGSQLMVKMLELLKWQGYERASLAVQKSNYAVKMYKNVGFKTIDENAEEYIMVCEL
jgi:ribosomal protein S18 acetylase RimI-like enzyme